jgi:hypothetical protein
MASGIRRIRLRMGGEGRRGEEERWRGSKGRFEGQR